MLKLIRFLLARNSLLLFLGMEFISFILLINNNLYLKYKENNLATEFSGIINSKIYEIKKFSELTRINSELLQENASLRKSILKKHKFDILTSTWDSLDVIPAYVITNQYQMANNIVILNKGTQAGIHSKMGVMGNKGIIGVTLDVSPHFSAVLTLLNQKNMISVRPKNSKQFGFLKWDNKDPYLLNLVDLPFETKIKLKDTIVTAGNSNIFPEGLPVGIVVNIKRIAQQKTYEIKIKSFENFTALNTAYVYKNKQAEEYEKLKDSVHGF